MEKLHIVLKYPDSARLWRVWADSENEIDFRHDSETGARCTAAYAASELKYFLGKAMPGLEIGVGETPPAYACFIELEIRGNDFTGSFELEPQGNGIRVTGYGRSGLLNGIYELLRIQGWRWLEPGIYGESAPENPTLDFLKAKGKFAPSFRHRMIDQYRESDDSADLLHWFSRNRVNAVFRKAATGKLNYHNALRLGRSGSREWLAVEKTAAKLNEWLVPATYENPGPGVQVKDGLSRSLLRMCITRCRGARIKAVNSKIKRKD